MRTIKAQTNATVDGRIKAISLVESNAKNMLIKIKIRKHLFSVKFSFLIVVLLGEAFVDIFGDKLIGECLGD